MDHGRPELRGVDPRLHNHDPAGVQVAGQIRERDPEVPLAAQVTDGAEEAAHDVEPLAEPKRTHVPEHEPDPRETAARDPEHLAAAVDPDHRVCPTEELEVSPGPAGYIQPGRSPPSTEASCDRLETLGLGAVILHRVQAVVVLRELPVELERPRARHDATEPRSRGPMRARFATGVGRS